MSAALEAAERADLAITVIDRPAGGFPQLVVVRPIARDDIMLARFF